MSDALELPPLPAIDWLSQFVPVYAREHMQAYGHACQARLLAKLAEKEARIDYLERTHVEPEAWKAFEDGLKFAKERAEKAERELAELSEQMDKAMATFDGMRPVFESNRALRIERDELRAKLDHIRSLVNVQAKDDGLWFEAEHAPEAYLQQELRKLHSVIEGA